MTRLVDGIPLQDGSNSDPGSSKPGDGLPGSRRSAGPDQPIAGASSVREYLEIIRRAIRRTWRQAPEATVDDIAQDACLKVVQALERSPAPTNLPAYLYRVGANAALDALRKAARRKETPMVETQAGTAQPDQQAARTTLFQQVESALGTLSRDRQTAVRFYLLGYRPADTAALTGWSVHRIRNLVYRGLKDLRRALTRQGFDHELE